MAFKNIERKIEVFRRAVVPERIEFGPAKIGKILLAVDIHACSFESSESTVLLTSYLARRFNATVSVVCVAMSEEETEESDSAVFRAVELLASQGIGVEGSRGEGYPSENILRLAEKEEASLIIIPTPYAEKAEKPCVESLGTTVDIVLQRASCPTMLVKSPVQKPKDAVKNILLPIQSLEEYKAAEWALTLAEDDFRLLLLNVVDKSSVETAKEIAERLLEAEIDEDSTAEMLRKDVSTLMANIARRGHEKGIGIERRFRVGDEVTVTLEEMEKERSSMLILAAKPEKGNTIGSKVENLVRLSSIPILVVK
jgi:nucleotide-binding universal stress UspA family protein